LEEDHAALQALREADAAIDELLTHSENLKITIENGFFEQSNDWVEVATLVVPPAHVVRRATISGHWSDQGTGNQKGRVRLALLRGGALISEAAVPVLAPHGREPFTLELDLQEGVQASDVVEVQIIVGGGGGHALHLRGVTVALDAFSTRAGGEFLELAGAGKFSGHYLQIPGKSYKGRLWWHKDGMFDENSGHQIWYNGEWRVGGTGNHWWTNDTDPPLSGQWHGWEAGRHNLGGLTEFEATVVKRVEEDERVTGLVLDRCSSLVVLPSEVGGLRALTTLSLVECFGLAALPDTVTTLNVLSTLDLTDCHCLSALPNAIGGLKALQVFCLKNCTSLIRMPPDAIGELQALMELNLEGCSNLAELPTAIGELGALKKLNLRRCPKITALPGAIYDRKALTVMHDPWEDFAALRELRDESDGPKEEFGADDDPRAWTSRLTFDAERPRVVEISRLRVATETFELSARITPMRAHYGMIASHDKSGDGNFQFRLEIYESMRVSLACDGTGCRGGHSDGDPNGCRSEVVTDPLPLHETSLVRVTRDAAGRFSIYVNDVLASTYHEGPPVDLGIGAVSGHTFRIGSRHPDVMDPFQGKITDAYISGANPVTVADDWVTRLDLASCTFTVLPNAVGRLSALMALSLTTCGLKVLPDAIGGLKALKELYLRDCPELVALPETISRLGALTTLVLESCESLVALPDGIGGLSELTTLDLKECNDLIFPPKDMHGDLARMKRYLASVEAILAGKFAEAEDDERDFFFEEVLLRPFYAERLGKAVRSKRAFAHWTNAKGVPALEVACYECREQMQKAQFFLEIYNVDESPPLHFSATAAVLGAIDHTDKSRKRRALKVMRDPAALLRELEGRAGLDPRYVVAVTAVYVCTTVADADFKQIEEAAAHDPDARDSDAVVVRRADHLGEDVTDLLSSRSSRKLGDVKYDYLLVVELADESLNHKITHGGVCATDFLEICKIARDLARRSTTSTRGEAYTRTSSP